MSNEAADTEIETSKAELRARMRAQLRSIPPKERERRARAAARLLAVLPEVIGARTVLVFWSFGSEIPTQPLIEALSRPGRTVLLPFVEGGRMRAGRYGPGDALVATEYGPLEPADRVEADPRHVDAVVVPGLAFDREGNRLGQGGGHYDAYLPDLRSDAVRIGLCYREQLLDQVPRGPTDQRVDLVVTDREVIVCHGRGRGAAR